MCFIFTCGEHEFSSQLKGYESVLCQCHNCGNYSAKVIKRHPWFTFCFVPVLPLSFHAYEDVVCSICNFAQPLQNRADVQSQINGGGQVPLQSQPPAGGGGGPANPGWGGGGGQPGAKQSQPMQYG
ncbi:ribonuclease p complex subunit [Sclerotinia borealis F-4128]|uniref:Ribonuclease p complex subunit n=1 Tax=Sclerotinia borealis (strain F-4128) TaxID=1432307 RepID=W9CUF7_SCLBF|nr:ribonuclease p complex subunit [Sclerotinia borealis F-4128]